MRDRSDADRREALSRAMHGASMTGGGGRRTSDGRRKSSGKVLMLILLLAGGVFVVKQIMQKPSVTVTISDDSAKPHETQQSKQQEEQETQQTKEQTPYEIPDMVRVVLMNSEFSSIYHDRLVIGADGGGIEITAAALRTALADIQLRLQQEGRNIEKKDGYYLIEPGTGPTVISSISRTCGAPAYRGRFHIYTEGERLVIVNELGLEEYLYGVLPSEMPASYHEEALKAQAVCARTFACAVMQNMRYPNYDAHMDDSTSYQVYGNLAEHENTTKAVDMTKGNILLFEDRPVSTYYYSTSGGVGSDIGVWQGFTVSDYPYLSNRSLNEAHEIVNLADNTEFASYLSKSHDDIECEHAWYRWKCSVSGVDSDLMYEKLKERYQVRPEGIELVADAAGRQSDAGTGTEISKRVPHPGAIRNLYIEQRTASGCAVCLYVEGEHCSYRVWGEYNIRYLLCDGATTVERQDGSEVVMNRILPSAYLILTPTLDNGFVIGYSISGGGYGHGVGMSQNGADAMAAEGKDYTEILSYFYMGTELKIQE